MGVPTPSTLQCGPLHTRPVPPRGARPDAPLPGEGSRPGKPHRGAALTCRRAGPSRAGPSGLRTAGPLRRPGDGSDRRRHLPSPPSRRCPGRAGRALRRRRTASLGSRDDGVGMGRCYGGAMMGRSSLRFAAQRGGRHVWMVSPPCWDGLSAMLGEAGGRGHHVGEVGLRRRCQGGSRSLSLFHPVSLPHPQPREAQLGHGAPLCPQGRPSAPAAALPCPGEPLRDLERLRARQGGGM